MTTPKNLAGMTPGGSFGFSPALLGQSPAALLKHKSPLPSGGFGSSPGAISALGIGLGVGNSMGLNMVSTAAGQGPPDENRKAELAEILKLLHSRPGRVSEIEIERLAKGMGLESYKETGENGIVTVSVAAKIFLLDIDFSEGQVARVAISFENTPGPSMELAPIAASIFQETLSPAKHRITPNSVPLLPPSLSAFSENLQRLALTDKLSKPGLNCFTAITGIYESLKKIYDYEKENIGGLGALCFGNGYPQMHTRQKVGLSVDYWRSRRTVSAEEDDVDVKYWRVLIEVQEHQSELASVITPVRSSSQWVSDDIQKPKEDNLFGDMDDSTTDWLEPPLEEFTDVPADPSHTRPSVARFSARLDPPVAVAIFDELDPNPGTDIHQLVPLLFPTLALDQHHNRIIYIPKGTETGTVHSYRIHSSLKPVFSRIISEVPFSHPKELLPMFKTLRQYTLLETLLRSCFSRDAAPDSSSPLANYSSSADQSSADDDLEAFLVDDTDISAPLKVDLSLMPEQAFGIDVVFPVAGDPIHISIQVDKNGELKANVPEGGMSGTGTGLSIAAFEKGLRACEDIPLMVEWARRSCLGLL